MSRHINGKKTIIDGITFDSLLEASTYRILKSICETFSLDLEVHYPCLIRAKSDYYPAKAWKIDYRLTGKGKRLYIEVKGQPQEYKVLIDNVKNLALYSPVAYTNLMVVVPQSYKLGKKDLYPTLQRSLKIPIVKYGDLAARVIDYFR